MPPRGPWILPLQSPFKATSHLNFTTIQMWREHWNAISKVRIRLVESWEPRTPGTKSPAAFLWSKDSPGSTPWLSPKLWIPSYLTYPNPFRGLFSVNLDYPETPRRQFQTNFTDRARHQDSKWGTERKVKCIMVEISRSQSLRFEGF